MSLKKPVVKPADVNVDAEVVSKLGSEVVNEKTVTLVRSLMETAEVIFDKPKSGAEKKKWVKEMAIEAGRKIDIKWLPNFIENPIKDGIISIVIDVLWALLFKKAKA